MIRHIHHPSCPAGSAPAPAATPLSPLDARWAAEAAPRCICPSPAPARRTQLAELVSFAAMLGLMAGLPIYLLWRYTA